MTALNLVRIPIDVGKLARWAGLRGWARRGVRHVAFDEGRALHHLIGEALGPKVFKSFRLLVAGRRTQGNLYAYSPLNAGTLRAAASAHALPEHLGVLDPNQIDSKPMPAHWQAGQRLGFDVRVRPIRRLRSALEGPGGRFKAGAEVDAFLVATLRHTLSEEGGRTRESTYLEWLGEQIAPAASLDRDQCRLARFRRVRVARGGRGPEGPDATIHGNLVVSDPEGFAETLARGVGRHRAYGYGMLLLRPPNHPPPTR